MDVSTSMPGPRRHAAGTRACPPMPCRRRGRGASLALLALLCALTPACRSAPSRFFVLTALAERPAAARGDGPTVLLHPVELPELLDRPQLVTVVSGHERRVVETARWAERLDENVTRVVAENLSRLLDTERVVRLPDRAPGAVAELRVELLEFAADPVAARLEARWSWAHSEGDGPPRRARERIEVPLAGSDDEAVVAAMSACLNELSLALARDLERGAADVRSPGDAHAEP